jgi:ketosteroid isomerase-like protein
MRLPRHSRLRRATLVRSVRQGYAALNRRDFDVTLTAFHANLIYHPRSDEPDPSPHIGLAAYERLLRGFVDAFSEVTIEVLDLIDAGEHVIVSTVVHGRIGGGEVTDTYVFVFKLHNGLIVEGWEYKTTDEALEAAGLSE